MTITRKMADFAADVPSSIGSASQVLKVNSGATAYEWQAIGDTLPSGASAGQVLKRNAGNSAYEWGDSLPSGAAASQVLQRNAGNSAYVWADSPEAALNIDASGNPTLGTGVTSLELRTLLSAQQSAIGLVPPNWASPSNTYTSSGTWSKGSLADTDIVWAYCVGGGCGGQSGTGSSPNYGGGGGHAMFIVATAAQLDGVSYVVGAGGASGGTAGGQTTITVSGVTYTTGGAILRGYGAPSPASSGFVQLTGDNGSSETTTTYGFTYNYPSKFGTSVGSGFKAGDGNTIHSDGSGSQATTSTYAGAGGLHPGNPNLGGGEGTGVAAPAGAVPGGGGGSSWGSSGGAGGNGNIRFYHV